MGKTIQYKEWEYAKTPSEDKVEELRKALNLSEVTATLLLQRGIETYDEAFHFFRDTLEHSHDPFLMDSMNIAVERLSLAIHSMEKILFFGDYDVDGTTSVSLLKAFFGKVYPDLECDFYVPDRYSEGYGVSERGIDIASEKGVTLMITLDCGIRAIEKVDYAKQKGIDTIICDHHEPGKSLPNAIAILDPKIPGNAYPFKELSGCGVGFKLLEGLCEKEEIHKSVLYEFLDFVAISSACDIVPIVDENRIFVREGLKIINKNPRTGVKALIEVAGFKSEITVSNLVFGVGPRINAAGRIAHANYAVNLLLSNDKKEAFEGAKSVDIKNELRKGYDAQITEEALELISKKEEPYYSNVLYKEDWHKGVIGIVASRCIEKVYKPTIILTESNGKATGSARSIKGFNIHDAILECAKFLDQFGGHMYAAGLTLPIENVLPFSNAFEQVVKKQLSEKPLIPILHLDLKIKLNQISLKLYQLIRQMAPFGPSNMEPTFGSENVIVVGDIRVLKEKHLKFKISHIDESDTYDVIGFNMIDYISLLQSSEPVRVCYQLNLNEYRGNKTLQLMLKDIQPMKTN